MALVVYDQGYRIQTPTRTLFNRTGVETLQEPARSRPLPRSNDLSLPPEQRTAPTTTRNPSRARNAYEQNARPTGPSTRSLSTMPISTLMSRPVFSIQAGEEIQEAWALFEDHQVRHLAVIDDAGRLQGLLGSEDLLRRTSRQGRVGPVYPETETISIEGAYSTRVMAATLDTEVRQVVLSFLDNHLSAMPILDSGGRLAGIVTRSDLLRFILNAEHLEQWV